MALVALATVAAACSSNTGTTTTSGASATSARQLDVTLNGSGATFPTPFYEEAISQFKKQQPGVTINYAGGGSGKGRQELQDQVVDFAGSDGLVKDEDKPKYKGGDFLYFPTVAAPITVSYNLPDVKTLKLSPDTIADIFQRKITTWNHPDIAADNPGVTLPPTPIVVAHRSDGSGTTENFTKFLVAASPKWTLKSGATVEWPADTQGGNGNAGVAQIVKGTVGGIGYVDLSDAKASGLQFAQVKNKAGTFVEPTLDATSAALDGAEIKADLSYNPLWASGEKAYPIAAPTWILVYKKQTDPTKADALKAFLRYVLTDGQKIAKDIDYAPLPGKLTTPAIAQIDTIGNA